MPEPINETFLDNNVKNVENKTISAVDCDKTMLQFFYSKKNLYDHVKAWMSVHELSQWLISLKSYLYRKSLTSKFGIPQRQEVLIDLGFAYGNELAYKHHAVVLRKANDKLFIVPLSTSKNPYKMKYDQQGNKVYKLDNCNNKIVDPSYFVGMKSHGFTRDNVTLLLDDARWISRNRVIAKLSNKITEEFFKDLKILILNRAIPSLGQDLETMESEIKKLKASVKALNEQIDLRNDKIKLKNQEIENLSLQLSSVSTDGTTSNSSTNNLS